MAILTRSELASIARSKAGHQGLSGRASQYRAFSKSTSKTTIFLSHSHLDKDVVEQAKFLFEGLGISIYVDWADETMPEKTNGTTALKIKNQIKTENDKFVLLATNNAVSSKWCNWEIGIADNFKYSSGKMAVLPLADNNGYWQGNEYLLIYPRIEYIKALSRTNTLGYYIEEGYYVLEPQDNEGISIYVKIEDWLAR